MGYYAFALQMAAPGAGIYHRRGEASMVQLADGKLLLAYGRYRGRRDGGDTPIEGDNDRAAIAAVRLNTQGRVEGEEQLLIPEPESGLNVMAPALRRLPDGSIGMLYSYRKSKTEARRMFATSHDEGHTWSEPVVLEDHGTSSIGSFNYQTGCHDRLAVLSNGDLIAPLHAAIDWDEHYLCVIVARSSDSGHTWRFSEPVKLPQVAAHNRESQFVESGCVEPGVVEREDGSLLMVLRTAMGTLFSSESFDRGLSWSGPRSMEVVSPQAPAHLSRIPGTSHLLLVWTSDYDASAHLGGCRHTLMTCVSKDGGRTWPHAYRKVLVHDPQRHTDYPSVYYHGHEAWITMRMAAGPAILDGAVGTAVMKVPIVWFYQ